MTYEFHVMHGVRWSLWPRPFTRWFEQSCMREGRHGRGDWWKVSDFSTRCHPQPMYIFSSRVIER